jgi:hypothetical protein
MIRMPVFLVIAAMESAESRTVEFGGLPRQAEVADLTSC